MWVPAHRLPSFVSRKKAKTEPTMSNFLKQPKTEKLNAENVQMCGMEIGHSSIQGYRVSMEDEHVIERFEILPDHVVVAIMDGHAGTYAAQFSSAQLRMFIEDTEQWTTYTNLSPSQRSARTDLISQALVYAFKQIDEDLGQLNAAGLMDESGTTCVCSVITPTHVVCASVGDSRCVVGTQFGDTIALTEDHKPSMPAERARIVRGGGFVVDDRVNGELAMSRALGDFRYKNDPALSDSEYLVTCYPDVAVHKRSGAQDSIMILACDGVWDVIENNEATSFLTDIILSPDVEDSGEEEEDQDTSSDTGTNSSSNSDEDCAPFKSDCSDSDDDEADDSNVGVNKRKFALDYQSRVDKRRKLSMYRTRKPSLVLNNSAVSALEAADSLIELALTDGSTDNISAIVVKGL